MAPTMKRRAETNLEFARRYFQLTNPIEKLIPNFKIPDDLLYNILHFLDRKEIESKRMVSKQWNFNILRNDSILPLLILGKISYSPAFGRMCWNIMPEREDNPNPHPGLSRNVTELSLDSLSVHFLKSHVYKEIVFSTNDREIEMLKKILKRKDRKLNVATAIFEVQGNMSFEMFDEDMRRMRQILDEVVTAKKIHLKFVHCLENSALRNFLVYQEKWSNPYESIKIDVTQTYADEVTNEDLLKLFYNSSNNVDLLLNYQSLEENLGVELIEKFTKHKNPESMARSISYINKNRSNDKYQEFVACTKMYLEKRKVEILLGRFVEFYCLKRDDGWNLNVIFDKKSHLQDKEVETSFTIEKL